MTRSIVGRFLILAVLLVSLGVIVQAALIISKGSTKAVAKTDAPAAARPAVVASTAPAPPAPAPPAPAPPVPAPPAPATATPAVVAAAPVPQVAPAAPAPAPAPAADSAPVRVVYPGPLGDGSSQPHKFVAAAAPAPAVPPAVPSPAPQPAAAPQAATPPAPAAVPAKPAPVVLASAGTQPVANPPAASRGGVNLNNASVDALNHLGGGHIGESIVRHRPYGSVEDLVRKRVVRRSVYEQIKNQVAAQ